MNQYKLNDTYKPVSEATKQHSTRNESNALQNWREKMVERKKHQGYISKESFIFALYSVRTVVIQQHTVIPIHVQLPKNIILRRKLILPYKN